MYICQDYVETAEWIDCPAPLPESPANDLLIKMLVPAPYKGSEKKADKKAPGTQKGLRRKAAPKASSEEDEEDSSPEGEEGEEEEAALSGQDGGPETADQGTRRGPRRKAVIPLSSNDDEADSSCRGGEEQEETPPPHVGGRGREEEGRPGGGDWDVQEGKSTPSGLLRHRRR